LSTIPSPPSSPLFTYTTLFRSFYQNFSILGYFYFGFPQRLPNGANFKAVVSHVVYGDYGRSFRKAIPFHHRNSRSIENPCKPWLDRKSTRLNSSHVKSSYAVFC